MRTQVNNAAKVDSSDALIRRLQTYYRALQRTLNQQPLISQGTVNVIKPKSPNGKTLYTWTRKVRAKTVTVSLSTNQAVAFRKAIEINRRIEKDLAGLREVSQAVLTSKSPASTKDS